MKIQKEKTFGRSEGKLYVVDGNPTPLARARHGNGRCWDSQKQAKVIFGIFLSKQHEGCSFFEGPIHMDIYFYMPIPKMAKKKINKSFHKIKPDLSNLIKFVEDAGSGILYKDDSVISSINAKKIYSEHPRTEIVITEI